MAGLRLALLAIIAFLSLCAWKNEARAQAEEAPFGDEVSNRIPRYHRAGPHVATSNELGRLGLMEAKGVGFRAVLDLRPDREAHREAEAIAEYALLRYFAVPVTQTLPTDAQIEKAESLLADPSNLPLLIYGEDDQAAALWALVRRAQGVAPDVALYEGRTAGLRTRLGDVRKRLQAAPAESAAEENP